MIDVKRRKRREEKRREEESRGEKRRGIGIGIQGGC